MIKNFLNTYWYPYFYTYKEPVINFSNKWLYPWFMVFGVAAGALFGHGYWVIASIIFIIGGCTIEINRRTRKQAIEKYYKSLLTSKNT